MIKQEIILLKIILIILLVSISNCKTYEGKYEAELLGSDNKYFEYEDLSIKYSDHGSGQTIVFVHGLGSSSFTWRFLYKYFSLNYRVISLDLKGFGESSKPFGNDYMVSDQAKIIHSFLVNMNLNDVTLVGNSYGGAVVLSTFLNAKHKIKERISKLVLLDPAAYSQKELPGYVGLLRTPVFNRIALTLWDKNIIAKYVLKEIFHDDSLITDEMITTYSGYLKGSQSHNALIETAKNISSVETESMSTRYNQIDIPVLIIWGEFDEVINKSMGEQLNRDILNSKLVIISDCGHVPQEELPEETIAIIGQFL